MRDPRALSTFNKYEAGAALAASQDKTPGRPMDKAYLDGAFSRELGKSGATTAEQQEIRKTIVPQSDARVGSDVIPELKANNGLSKAQNDAAKVTLDSLGMKDAVVIDSNKNGRIDAEDRVISKNASGQASSQKMVAADEVNAAAGANAIVESHAKNGKPEFMPNKPKAEWFPQKHWDYDDKTQNWKLKPGVSASEAMQYYRDHPKEFGGDCGAMKQMTAQSSLMEQLGPKDYDALAKKEGLAIGFSTKHNSEGLSKKVIDERGSWGDEPSTYAPGSQGYAHCSVPGDPKATEQLKDLNWAGEHFNVTMNEKGAQPHQPHHARGLSCTRLLPPRRWRGGGPLPGAGAGRRNVRFGARDDLRIDVASLGLPPPAVLDVSAQGRGSTAHPRRSGPSKPA